MSTWQDGKPFLVGDEDSGRYDKRLHWFTKPALNLSLRRQISSQLQDNSKLLITVTQRSEPIPPTHQTQTQEVQSESPVSYLLSDGCYATV